MDGYVSQGFRSWPVSSSTSTERLGRPGVSLMGHILKPRRLLQDVQRMGITMKENRPAPPITQSMAEMAYSAREPRKSLRQRSEFADARPLGLGS